MTRGCWVFWIVLLVAWPVQASADDGSEVSVDHFAPKVRVEAIKAWRPSERNVKAALHKEAGRLDLDDYRFIPCPVSFEVGRYGCRTFEDEDDDREVTDGDVLRAAREIGLPQLPVTIQPGEQTLVNADTIFSTTPQAFDHSVTLLGFGVDIVATATSYTWHHGDGTSSRTSTPGRPYPAFDVTHRYQRAADSVRPRVDVTYRIRYRVDGGPWRTIDQTVTAAGPAAELDVREAVPVLVKR